MLVSALLTAMADVARSAGADNGLKGRQDGIDGGVTVGVIVELAY
jgi:hypothetical protein